MFRERVSKTPNLEAFSYPVGDRWESMNWTQVAEQVDLLAAGMLALGIADDDRVGLVCSTRLEWLLGDIAINVAGAATSTIYPSSTADDCAYILSDSAAKLCIAENDAQVRKLQEIRSQVGNLAHVIVIDGQGSDDGWVLSWDELKQRGKAWSGENPTGLDDVLGRLDPSRLSTLIYTSGTTGRPKGVELTHDCWMYTGEAIDTVKLLNSDDKQYLWLPLSHSFGKMLETLVIAIGIPTAVDGRIDKIIDNLAVVRPTFMAAAPRIFEKVYNKVVNGAQQAGGLKFAIFKWALGVGRAASKELQAGRQPSGLLGLQFSIADKLVFSKLRERFGGRVRFFISGSAPLNREIAEFFHAAGLLILEGYGLTESSAASFVNRPESNKFGTVGPPLPGTEVKIAEDGEILFRGRGIMRGYHNLADVTAETLLEGGWLATGDIGEVDPDGHLRITDRKKDLIKTSGGKYVAPQALEGSFKAVCPYVSQILVHGNNRNFCSALITMEPEAIAAWAADNGLGDKSYEQLAQEPKVIALFQGYVDQLNAPLARFETIKKFALLPADFAIETGELTPSLKVKRKAVEAKYKDLLDDFYAGAMAGV
ncbi:MAG: long-chain fatty acid--CoA ligase [Deltaproteobacteria bacterium]|nr:long-chain fatty acid--CoA ligase [Deltaproteobacteria bacterium]